MIWLVMSLTFQLAQWHHSAHGLLAWDVQKREVISAENEAVVVVREQPLVVEERFTQYLIIVEDPLSFQVRITAVNKPASNCLITH